MEPNRARDRAMLVAFEAGQTVEQLARDHALTLGRVRDILKCERHKRNLSPEPFYRAIREAGA